jgi:phage tail-like protein
MPSLGIGAAFSLGAGLLGGLGGGNGRSDPYQGFNFLVEIEGLIVGGFSECSGLSVETEYFEFREGGCNEYVHRFAGQTKYPALILKHGLTQLDGLWAWHQDVGLGKIQRRNGSIQLRNKEQVTVMQWDFKEALPFKWSGPDLRADSSSVAIESVELSHHGLSRPSLSNVLATVGAKIDASFAISIKASLKGSLF